MCLVTTLLIDYTMNPTKKKTAFMENQKFGQFILSFRKEKGWEQPELAEKLHVTNKAIAARNTILKPS